MAKTNRKSKTVKKTNIKTAKRKLKQNSFPIKIKKNRVKVQLKPNKKMFSLEIALLDKLQNELFDAISAKPSTMDFEEIRLFVDNVYMTLNKCSMIAKDIKNSILKKDFDEPITNTYNSPA